MKPMQKQDPFDRIREALGEGSGLEDESRRDLIYQALIYAEDLKELHREDKVRANELEAAKESLERSAERMKQAERSREDFISNCSHELRTPLTPIIGWAKVLSTKDLQQDEVREFAETIHRQGERLLQVVDSLLRVASIQRNYKRTIEPVRVNIPDLLEMAAGMIRVADRSVEVTVQPGSEWAMAEQEYLAEVVLHLVDNAIKFTPKGTAITLGARKVEQELVVAVADRGPGIPEPDRERIFEPFTQGDSSSTRLHGGLGAGLYICRELVDAHGGRIWVEEAAGGGATFQFTIPQHRASDSVE